MKVPRVPSTHRKMSSQGRFHSHDNTTSKQPVGGVQQPPTGNNTQADTRSYKTSFVQAAAAHSSGLLALSLLRRNSGLLSGARTPLPSLNARYIARASARPAASSASACSTCARGSRRHPDARAREPATHRASSGKPPARPAARRAARVMTRCRTARASCRGPPDHVSAGSCPTLARPRSKATDSPVRSSGESPHQAAPAARAPPSPAVPPPRRPRSTRAWARPARRARRASSGPSAAGRGRAGVALAPAVRRRALWRPGWTAGGAFGAGRRRLAGRADAAAAPVVPCGERRRNALLRRSQAAAFAPAGQLQQLRARGHAWRQRALPARRRSPGREVQQRALAALARTSTWGAACHRRGGTW